MNDSSDYLCVGVCLPDADEAYCIGCGRSWGAVSAAAAVSTVSTMSAPVSVLAPPTPPTPPTPPRPAYQVIERGWLSSNSILLFDDATDSAAGTATLIDSGYVGHAAQTVALIKSALAGRRLTRLINTHSHSDHIGGNAALQKAFGCDIVIPAGIEEHILNWDEQALLLTTAAQRGDRFRHDAVVRAGDMLQMGGAAWQVRAAPGHDMDALMFYCPDARLLISGDALWEDGFGIIFGELLGQPGALQATRDTLDMIARLTIDTVIPGHGKPFTDVPAALQRADARLAAFAADPKRMARNGIKACFIFNLLDLQGLRRDQLESYLAGVPFFRDVAAQHLGMDVPALAQWLQTELLRAGALIEEDGLLLPTAAA